MRPSCWLVWALKPLQNSMMLTPCWPSAGPTGGDGFAFPTGICSFTIAWTFLAMSEPFDLVVLELDRGHPAEDRDHHLELAALGVEVVDGALEVDERPLDHADLVAPLERGLELRLLRALLHLLEDGLDLVGRQRHRPRARADEAGHLGRRAHEVPGVVRQLHLHEEVAGEELLLDLDLLALADLADLLGGHHDPPEHVLEVEDLRP